MDDLMARHAQQQQTPKLVRRSPSPPTPRQRTPTAEARRAQPDTMQLDASSIRRHHLISKGIDPFSVELPSWLPWQSDAGLMHTSKPTDDQPSATTLELLEASRPGTPYLKALRQGGWTPLLTVCFFHPHHLRVVTHIHCTQTLTARSSLGLLYPTRAQAHCSCARSARPSKPLRGGRARVGCRVATPPAA